MVLVAKFAVTIGRRGLKRPYLPRFGVGFLCKFVSMIGVLQSPLQMPISQFVFPFFIMFGGRPMSVRSKFVLIGRLPVCVVHVFLPWRILRLQESLFYGANATGCLRVIPCTDRDHQK